MLSSAKARLSCLALNQWCSSSWRQHFITPEKPFLWPLMSTLDIPVPFLHASDIWFWLVTITCGPTFSMMLSIVQGPSLSCLPAFQFITISFLSAPLCMGMWTLLGLACDIYLPLYIIQLASQNLFFCLAVLLKRVHRLLCSRVTLLHSSSTNSMLESFSLRNHLVLTLWTHVHYTTTYHHQSIMTF